MPRECLRIIESKSKVRNSRNKAVVAKVSSNSYTPGISPDVAALTNEVSELKNLMKTMLIDKQKAQAPASVKAVEQSCVTCGGKDIKVKKEQKRPKTDKKRKRQVQVKTRGKLSKPDQDHGQEKTRK
ncbi:hypothetical protein Tco_1514453 [Tanacetum coccineum]